MNKNVLKKVIPLPMQQQLANVQKASRKLVAISDSQIETILNQLADLTLEHLAELLWANQQDLDRMDNADPKYDRLQLTESRVQSICADLRKVASLPSPLHRTLEERSLPSGLHLRRVTVPLGVIGIVYESRPNVTFDVFALCLKSGNATVLKGSKDAHFSNLFIVSLIKKALQVFDLEDIVFLAPSERERLAEVLSADKYIDCIIPRGSQGLINYVRQHSKIPVIETGAGIVHTYFDVLGDKEKGKKIITNAKARRVSVCNALDCLLIQENRLPDLAFLVEDLGKIHQCKLWADVASFKALQAHYPSDLLNLAKEEHFGTEFLSMQLAIKTVTDLEEAINHIAQYSSKHSEAIVSEDTATIETFLNTVDAAVVYANTSTAFTDGGEFGLGAEIGISTQKLHARGPMALRELTSYKWVVTSNGKVR
jgi:glutamate-5-semialdehyde dehydrogenase